MDLVYTLVQEVGRGSYGVVFEGRSACRRHWENECWERVAIKRLPCSSPESMELNLQELWALRAARRKHPNVIALHQCFLQTGPKTFKRLDIASGSLPLDLVENTLKGKLQHPRAEEDPQSHSSVLWLVMEFCEEGDLNRYLLSRSPSAHLNRSIMIQLSSAVAFLHAHHIVHRDLKPDNVLVSHSTSGPIIKVADFGLSRVTQSIGEVSQQCFSSTCGSEFYMAPEVWDGHYTAKADIFSLGVLFWAILERITYFEDTSGKELLGAYVCQGRRLVPIGEALHENPRLQFHIPLKVKRSISTELRTLLQDMLAVDPDQRPDAIQLEKQVRQAMAREKTSL
ncbi:STK35 kinase, partial [Atractosteus spatula]|nr:STK35 kinase [Atractosteus spatula]